MAPFRRDATAKIGKRVRMGDSQTQPDNRTGPRLPGDPAAAAAAAPVRDQAEKNRRAAVAWEAALPAAVAAYQTHHHRLALEDAEEQVAAAARFQARVDVSAAATHGCCRAAAERGLGSCLEFRYSDRLECVSMERTSEFLLPTYRCNQCFQDVTPSAWDLGCVPCKPVSPKRWFCQKLLKGMERLTTAGASTHSACVCACADRAS